jgi:hypothetical protein
MLIKMMLGSLYGVLKIVAIAHPGAPTNRIIELFQNMSLRTSKPK